MLDNVATRLLNAYVEKQQNDDARELVHEILRDRGVPRFLARAAAWAERIGDRDLAIVICERLCAVETNGPNAVGSLIKLGALRRANGDMRGAREAFIKARSHPACSAEMAPAIDAKLAHLS